ncbi:MAG: hypothetical protein H7321_05400 [Bacteroidia bacterium]|nr:hypothetical protein [Bacteroidia bacterium]
MISFKAFRAIDNPENCQQFIEGHRRVLEGFNLTNISTNKPTWPKNPNIYVITAKSDNSEHLLGGIRIQIADGINPLPVEDAVGHFDKNIFNMVKQYSDNGGTCELCGLWNSREEAPNMGITFLLVIAGMSIVNQLPVTSMFTIVAAYTLRMATRIGFQVETSLGNDGTFIYPNSNYVARVLSQNPHLLTTAAAEVKASVMDLRNNPVHIRKEKVPKGEVEISYDLIIR